MSLSRQIVKATPGERLAKARELLAPAAVRSQVAGLPGMVRAAAAKLASATTAAEVLDAKDAAGVAYSAAVVANRIAKARGAHDDLVAAVHRAQADALEIEAAAKRRLADEYDRAQRTGEIKKSGGRIPDQNSGPATAADVGIPGKVVHDARRLRNAEEAKPGVVRAALDKALADDREPTRAVLSAAVADALGEEPTPSKPRYPDLQSAWDAATETERTEFLARNGLTVSRSSKPNTSPAKTKPEPAGANPGSGPIPRKPFVLRPHCLDRECCAGQGAEHCHRCTKAMAGSEVA